MICPIAYRMFCAKDWPSGTGPSQVVSKSMKTSVNLVLLQAARACCASATLSRAEVITSLEIQVNGAGEDTC